MKRQVAILGPTPEFLRWSVRRPCPMRQNTDLGSVDQTEKRLRAIRAAGSARAEGEVVDGFALRRTDGGDWLGFRLADVFEVFGGESLVTSTCQSCPANIIRNDSNGDLAGCCGWLVPNGPLERIHEWIEAVQSELPAGMFLPTSPVWYGLWSHGAFSGKYLTTLRRVVLAAQQADLGACPKWLTELASLVAACDDRGLELNLQLVPRGESNGTSWVIAPHCDRCLAPYESGQRFCSVCRKQGAGHPVIVRRALGLRPWGPLHNQLSSDRLAELIERSRERQEANGSLTEPSDE